jgi:hypothetical protein
VRTDSPALAAQVQAVYRHFPLRTAPAWADIRVRLGVHRPRLRWWQARQAYLYCDGRPVFPPLPADTLLPLLEWGCNWLIAQRMNHVLLLHSGVVERDGCALVLPAMPGSGKSTLTAALALSGWRLLSDEFGAYDPSATGFRAVLKPVALKNDSIGVIRRFSAAAELGPEFPNTRKGTVAHLAPPATAVARVHEVARPGAIVLPKWRAAAATRFEPVQPEVVFSALAFNAFNYPAMGATGFHSVVHLVRSCPAWQLVYSDLDDALATLDAAWPEVLARQRDAADHEQL